MNDNTPEKTTANRSLAHAQPYVAETVSLLDPRAEGGIAVHDSSKGFRMWAATISAGWKVPGEQHPRVVRDGVMRLHEDTGEAPGIKAALAATGGKSLTITMLSDSIADCLKQMLCSYGATKVFGDQNALTVMKMEGGQVVRSVITKDDPKFGPTLKLCKAVTFVPFALAEWGDDNEPKMQFPDGLMPYRLRFGSVNSARLFVDSLQAIKALTGGRLKGVPLMLSLSYQSKMYPDPADNQLKRTVVPIWRPVLKHPKGITLGARDIQRVMLAGMADAEMLALPASIDMNDPEVVEAIIEGEQQMEREVEADPGTGEVIDAVFTNANPDLRTATTQEVPRRRVDDYFRATQNTPFATDAQRPNMVRRMAIAAGVELGEPSLALLAEKATADEWDIANETLCKALAAYHGTEEFKPAKAVVSAADPYADAKPVTGTKPVVAPAETPAAVAPVEDPKPKPAQAKKREPAEKVEEPTPAPAEVAKPTPAAVLPTVNNYVLLERQPTPAEAEQAVDYVAEHLTEDQFAKLVEFAGGINPAFVVLQARKNKVTDFGGFMRLIDHEWKEETN